MDQPLSLPAQEFIRICERLNTFNANHRGFPEADCEAILLHALDLIRNVQRTCARRHGHGHTPVQKQAA